MKRMISGRKVVTVGGLGVPTLEPDGRDQNLTLPSTSRETLDK